MFSFRRRKVSVDDVLKHFIIMEASRKKYADRAEEMLGWLELSNDEFIQKVREYEIARDDDNPVFGWTIGTRKNSFYKNISHWVLKEISLADLYTCGINSEMKADLDAVRGNLKRFVDTGCAAKYPEFKLDSVPPQEEAKIFIGIARSDCNRDGSIELIDGVHRAVTILARGIVRSKAYIGALTRR
jgi:hypothetical protein